MTRWRWQHDPPVPGTDGRDALGALVVLLVALAVVVLVPGSARWLGLAVAVAASCLFGAYLTVYVYADRINRT